MRKPMGYGITKMEGVTIEEEDTFTCAHGNEVVFVKPMQDPSEMGGFCRMCMAHICAKCAADGRCIPFEKKLEAMEGRDRFRRALVG